MQPIRCIRVTYCKTIGIFSLSCLQNDNELVNYSHLLCKLVTDSFDDYSNVDCGLSFTFIKGRYNIQNGVVVKHFWVRAGSTEATALKTFKESCWTRKVDFPEVSIARLIYQAIIIFYYSCPGMIRTISIVMKRCTTARRPQCWSPSYRDPGLLLQVSVCCPYT